MPLPFLSSQATWSRILISVVSVLLLLLLVISIVLWTKPDFLTRWVETRIQQKLQEASKGLYHFEYGSLQVDLPNSSLTMTDFTIYTDSIKEQVAAQNTNIPPLLVNFKAKEIVATNLSILALLVSNKLKLANVTISKSSTHLSLLQQDSTLRPSNTETNKEVIKRISVDQIQLENASVMIVDKSLSNELQTGIYNLTVELQEFDINPHLPIAKQNLLGAERISLKADKIELPSRDNLYTCILDSIRLDSYDSTFAVHRLRYLPILSKADFHSTIKVAKPRLDIDVQTIEGIGTDLTQLLHNQVLKIRQVSVANGTLDFYKDKHYPKPNKNYIGHYPHQLLLKAPIGVHLDSLVVANIGINYCELGSSTNRQGCISFEQTRGVIKNITNQKNMIAQNKHCEANLVTQFMHQAPLYAHFSFSLDRNDGHFTCQGKLGNFSISHVNDFVGTLAQASIQSGVVDLLDFTINATDYSSSIKMKMNYHDLKVNLFKQAKDGTVRKKRTFLMGLINGVLLEQANPKPGESPRIAEASVTRESNQPFFNIIWLTIQESLLRIVTGKDDKKTKS